MTEISMKERIARAICVEQGELPETATPYNKYVAYLWQHYLPAAEAVLDAMREPDKPMIHAACKAMSPGRRPTPDRVSVREKHTIRYQAMIDAAKAEEPKR